MGPELIGLIGLILLFAVLAIGMPIGLSMALVGFIGFLVLGGLKGALTLLEIVPFTNVAQYIFSTIPLFILMGNFAFVSGLTSDAYESAYKWFGHYPGGLAIATVAGCAGFAACSGSSVASIGVITSTALPEMVKYKYDPKLATGVIATGTTLGILIPPSVPFIVYAILSDTSIGKLFIAGILPGILIAALIILTVVIRVKANPELGPPGPKATWAERIRILKVIWPVILLAGIVLGGIWGGVCTPIEAGGMGAFGAMMIAIIRGRLKKKDLISSLMSSVRISSMVFTILIGAMIFNSFLALTGMPGLLANFVGGLSAPSVVIVVAIMFFYLIGGCLMDTVALMMLTLPIFIPILRNIGYDLILFGVLSTVMTEFALVTPPMGMNVFVLCGTAKNIPMYTVFRGVIPFLFAMAIGLILLIAFPQISLYLPNMMR